MTHPTDRDYWDRYAERMVDGFGTPPGQVPEAGGVRIPNTPKARRSRKSEDQKEG